MIEKGEEPTKSMLVSNKEGIGYPPSHQNRTSVDMHPMSIFKKSKWFEGMKTSRRNKRMRVDVYKAIGSRVEPKRWFVFLRAGTKGGGKNKLSLFAQNFFR